MCIIEIKICALSGALHILELSILELSRFYFVEGESRQEKEEALKTRLKAKYASLHVVSVSAKLGSTEVSGLP